MSGPPDLSVIVVSWNTRVLLEDCLASVFATTQRHPLEVFVVDNASRDDSVAMVRERFPQVRLSVNDENLGFARANNIALRMCAGRYALLLNSDTLIEEPDVLDRMVDHMDAHPETGASGCRLNFANGRHQVGDAGFAPTAAHVANHFLFLSRLFPSSRPGIFVSGRRVLSSREVVPVDWVCGAFFLVRRDILPTVGLLDEDVFMYAEDIEWGCRIRHHGYPVAYLPWVAIVHLQGESQKVASEGRISTHWIHNFARLYYDFNQGRAWRLFKVVLVTGFLVRAVLYPVAALATWRGQLAARGILMLRFARAVIQLRPPGQPQRS